MFLKKLLCTILALVIVIQQPLCYDAHIKEQYSLTYGAQLLEPRSYLLNPAASVINNYEVNNFSFCTTSKVTSGASFGKIPNKGASKVNKECDGIKVLVNAIRPLPPLQIKQNNGDANDAEFMLETSGPVSPEFSSFQSISTDELVNPFTGDLSYSLPVLKVPGAHSGEYALALAYNSGAGPDDDASWVGYGWTLSPGAISRQKNGIPDDINGAEVSYLNSLPTNITLAVSPSVDVQAFSGNLGITASTTGHYNNYKGFGGGYSFGLSAYHGLASLTYSMDDGTGSFSPALNLSVLLDKYKKQNEKVNHSEGLSALKKATGRWDINTQRYRRFARNLPTDALSRALTNYGTYLVKGAPGMPTSTPKMSGIRISLGADFEIDPFGIIVGAQAGITGQLTTIDYENKTPLAYGFLYSHNAPQNSSALEEVEDAGIMDYRIEKNREVTQRDQLLPMPYSTPDNYSVRVEGLEGEMRAFSNKTTMFTPDYSSSTTALISASAAFHTGTTVGIGAGLELGSSVSKTLSTWDDNFNGNTDQYKAFVQSSAVPGGSLLEDEPYFFRFRNDMGGNAMFSSDVQPVPLSIGDDGPAFSHSNHLEGASYPNYGGRTGRLRYVNYHTNQEILNGLANNLPGGIFDKRFATSGNAFVDRSEVHIKDHIGEFEINAENGNLYTFGLPVYNRDDGNISYRVEQNSGPVKFYEDATANGKGKTATLENFAYPASYLITKITNKEYVDIDNNGFCNDKDFGGYVTFDYKRKYGSPSKHGSINNWSYWRAPQNGLLLSLGDLWDEKDNTGTCNFGYKETYYTSTIETKTHIAVFITNSQTSNIVLNGVTLPNTTGSGISRTDVLGANVNEALACKNNSWTGTPTSAEKLEKIMLFAKSKNGSNTNYKLVATTHFKYDYSCWPGCPNSQGVAAGKLTLKKVWTERYDVQNAKIAPYEFDYELKAASTNLYPSKYTSIAQFYSNKNQVPNFASAEANYADAWGCFQQNGLLKSANQIPTIDQNPDPSFDISAWQLKSIKTPIGGEIHVQYEQDDYAFVQDKIAHIAVPLISADEDNSTFVLDIEKYYPGIDLNNYATQLNSHFSNNSSSYIYFRFLYDIAKGIVSTLSPQTPSCNSEFIEGYVQFTNASVINNQLQITIANGAGAPFGPPWITGTTSYKVPRNICYDFVSKQTGFQAGECAPFKPAAAGALVKLANAISNLATFGINCCKSITNEFSTFKVPIPHSSINHKSKLGGGMRVKRILKFSPAMKTNGSDATLYGIEYNYTADDGVSSGVATNEPEELHGENALVQHLQTRDPQTLVQKLIGGRDLAQFEGPYGYDLLPSPSVGYARVTMANIHEGKTDDGWKSVEYYTFKDFPCHNRVSDGSRTVDVIEWKILPLVVYNELKTKMVAAQSYAISQYNIHGSIRAEKHYLGRSSANQIYSKEYLYFKPGELIPTSLDTRCAPQQKHFGIDQDIIFERKHICDDMEQLGVQADVALGPLLNLSAFALPHYTSVRNDLYMLVANKVTSYPVIPKSIIETRNGMRLTLVNEQFNPYSAGPIVTTTTDDFEGVVSNGSIVGKNVYTYKQPAAHIYRNLEPIVANMNRTAQVNASISGTSTANLYNLTFGSGIADPSELRLVIGDLIVVGTSLPVGNLSSLSSQMFFVNDVTYDVVTDQILSFVLQDYDAMSSNITGAINFVKVLKSGRWCSPDYPIHEMITYGPILQSSSCSNLNIPDGITYKNVLKNSASALQHFWDFTKLRSYAQAVPTTGIPNNDFSKGKAGRWHLSQQYLTIKDRGTLPGATNTLNHNSGVYEYKHKGYKPKQLAYSIVDRNLALTKTVTAYTPHGEVAIEEDAINIPSAIQFTLNQDLPKLVVANANANSCWFESFEDFDVVSNNGGLTSVACTLQTGNTGNLAHSNRQSLKVATNGGFFTLPLEMNYDIVAKKVVVRLWASNNPDYENAIGTTINTNLTFTAKLYDALSNLVGTFTSSRIATSGSWSLYEIVVSNTVTPLPSGTTSFSTYSLRIEPPSGAVGTYVYVDDVKYQPIASQVNCYVYDNITQKLVSTLDEQHFQTVYLYNTEGQLVRKVIETERGFKQVQESQYNSANKVNR
jgi:hypothetical protein